MLAPSGGQSTATVWLREGERGREREPISIQMSEWLHGTILEGRVPSGGRARQRPGQSVTDTGTERDRDWDRARQRLDRARQRLGQSETETGTQRDRDRDKARQRLGQSETETGTERDRLRHSETETATERDRDWDRARQRLGQSETETRDNYRQPTRR
ncbi:hypothetical protein BaRGS_00033580, partial [Batillaria attramentaria]